jgi:PIN domain-containing protein
MANAMGTKLHRSPKEVAWRKQQMNQAFPEAMVPVPAELLKAVDCIPDESDRHVLAAAIMAHANTIVTQNTKHFPKSCLEKFAVLCQTADDFLIHQYHLCPQIVLDKLDDQGAGISRDRKYVIASLKASAAGFCKLLEAHTF